jgi:transposase
LKPHLSVQWCIPKVDGQYLACLEDILKIYALPYNPEYPVICFDERPCFLIGDVKNPIPMEVGKHKCKKIDYQYEKFGSCALLAAIEPLAGKRFAKVYERRTAAEYTDFMEYLLAQYPAAKKIILVQDNLNTHKIGSFYDHREHTIASDMADRVEFHYTPKSSSWLNMIEIEFSAISRTALNKRIPTIEILTKQIEEIVAIRNQKEIKIKWQFSLKKARSTLNTKYNLVNSLNKIT